MNTQLDVNFFSKKWNYTCHVPNIYTSKQLWRNNKNIFKKIFIINVFQIAGTELNEITFRDCREVFVL